MPRVAQPPEGDAFVWSPRGAGWFSSSMGRGLAILECFTPTKPVLRVIDIAEQVGMRASTTHRYLSTLTALGYLEQDAARRYRLALAVTRLGMSTMSAGGLREHANPYLQELGRETNYTTILAVLDGAEAVCIERLPALHRERPAEPDPGPRVPLYCAAIGKALLASLPPDEQNTLIGELALKRHTPNTITSKTELRAELNAMTEQGIAVEDQEHTTGINAIAAPIRDESGIAAAIALSAPASRIALEAMVDHLTPHLRSTADRISARLGHRRGKWPGEHR